MKKICFGIAIMMFAYITEVSLNLELLAFLAGIVGFGFACVGMLDKSDK